MMTTKSKEMLITLLRVRLPPYLPAPNPHDSLAGSGERHSGHAITNFAELRSGTGVGGRLRSEMCLSCADDASDVFVFVLRMRHVRCEGRRNDALHMQHSGSRHSRSEVS